MTANESATVRRRILRNAPAIDESLTAEIPKQEISLDRTNDDYHGDKAGDVHGKQADIYNAPPPPAQPINWTFLAVLTVASYATRFFKISAGNFVL